MMAISNKKESDVPEELVHYAVKTPPGGKMKHE